MPSVVPRSFIRVVVGAVGLMIAAAGCSSGGATAQPTMQLQPPTSWTADEQAIIDVYAEFRTELTNATRTKDGELETVKVLSSPRLAEALIDNIVGDRSVGNVVHGTYTFVPLSVTMLAADNAQILLCAWDQTFVYNEGEQLSDVPEAPSTAKVDMNLAEGHWLVNGIFDGEGQPCELQ